jgi:uncharacterized protein GlcG (DUF336 family)
MKSILMSFLCSTTFLLAQQPPTAPQTKPNNAIDWQLKATLNQAGAIHAMTYANTLAAAAHKKIALAILDASGQTILLTISEGVGPHNLEAARRKAFTALSTQTPTLLLARNAAAHPDTQNLNALPELLLLGGGVPVRVDNKVIGSIGIAGAGGPEEDHAIAQQISTIFNNLKK